MFQGGGQIRSNQSLDSAMSQANKRDGQYQVLVRTQSPAIDVNIEYEIYKNLNIEDSQNMTIAIQGVDLQLSEPEILQFKTDRGNLVDNNFSIMVENGEGTYDQQGFQMSRIADMGIIHEFTLDSIKYFRYGLLSPYAQQLKVPTKQKFKIAVVMIGTDGKAAYMPRIAASPSNPNVFANPLNIYFTVD